MRISQRLPDSHPRNRDRDRDGNRERDRGRERNRGRDRRGSRGATPARRGGGRRDIPGWVWLVAGIGGGMLLTSLLMKGVTAPATVADDAATTGAKTVTLTQPDTLKKPERRN